MNTKTRDLNHLDARHLRPGDDHHTAYVGPPAQWDFMGATQFRLLCALGLREWHNVLDLGCGSLRAGRFLLLYLEASRYFGLDPNRWLIDQAIEKEVGLDLINLKKPTFFYRDDFEIGDDVDTKFQYVVAQSIFSHAGPSLARRAFQTVSKHLDGNGLFVATFIDADKAPSLEVEAEGWLYPGCISYRSTTIAALATEAGLSFRSLPWFHPRQSWYVFAKSSDLLPLPKHDRHLSGAVLFDPEFATSIK